MDISIASTHRTDEKYRLAAPHSQHMTIQEAEDLSRVLAERIAAAVGKPDLVVGLANGALLPTMICGEALETPWKMVYVRRQGSRYKQKLLKIKEALHIPSSWAMIGPLGWLWHQFQERYSKLEETSDAFDFDVKGLHVVVVDDCIVSGNSLRYVSERIAGAGAAKVTTAVLCWTSWDWGGTLMEAPDIYLHRGIQWYPWSNNSQYWHAYLDWMKARGQTLWT